MLRTTSFLELTPMNFGYAQNTSVFYAYGRRKCGFLNADSIRESAKNTRDIPQLHLISKW